MKTFNYDLIRIQLIFFFTKILYLLQHGNRFSLINMKFFYKDFRIMNLPVAQTDLISEVYKIGGP